jgi:maltooligosyltrehalose trehalohydrolase
VKKLETPAHTTETSADDWALGARPSGDATRFRVFSDARRCELRTFDASGQKLVERPLEARGSGFFETELAGAGHGTLYRFVLDGRELTDPYARFLPFGVHGPAMVVEPRHVFRHACVARPLREQVLYELHVGTFTPAGTYAAAAERLPALAALGVTTLELMPIAAFAGERGWGYDGVALYAPHAAYGTPDELRAFVDAAHGHGLGVLLDVVYNHFGPSGNYLGAYSSRYFDPEARTPWGDAPAFADAPLRRYALDNARYWLESFRFDGLRLDATHAILDATPRHFLEELAEAAHALAPRRVLIAEDERNRPELVTETGLDAIWADDFHHQVHVQLTAENEGHYSGFSPGVADLARSIERGWLYEGQVWPQTGKPRGASAASLSAEHFVYALQNHDQVGNRGCGERLHALTSLGEYLAVSLLFLCLPMTPLLFMGQEWAASTPFLYFTDHETELGKLVTAGRRREFEAFRAFREAGESVPDPQAEATFAASKLVWEERLHGEHARTLALYRSALALRRSDPVLQNASRERVLATSSGDVLIVRLFHGALARAIVVNFGDQNVELARLPNLEAFARATLLLGSGPLSVPGELPAKTAVLLGADLPVSPSANGTEA